MNIDTIPCIATACCILHSMCEAHVQGDTFNELWMEEVDSSTQPVVTVGDNNANPNAKAIRDALVDYYKCQ